MLAHLSSLPLASRMLARGLLHEINVSKILARSLALCCVSNIDDVVHLHPTFLPATGVEQLGFTKRWALGCEKFLPDLA